jgi:hypothetical protein
MKNIIEKKSFDFAIRIVKLYKGTSKNIELCRGADIL